MFLLRFRSYNLQSFEKQHVWLLSDVAVCENAALWFGWDVVCNHKLLAVSSSSGVERTSHPAKLS